MHTITDTERGIAEWLAGALDEPRLAHQEWETNKVAMLPLGERFTAVRIAADIVHAAVTSTASDVVSSVLSKSLAGPVIHDAICHRYYAITPNLDVGGWRSTEGAVLVGRGTWLGVPRLDQTTPQRYSYWAVPPNSAQAVCDLGRVVELIRYGREQLAANQPKAKQR